MNKSILASFSILVLLVPLTSTVRAQAPGLLGVQAAQPEAHAAPETVEAADAHAKQLLAKVAEIQAKRTAAVLGAVPVPVSGIDPSFDAALKQARADCAAEARTLLSDVEDYSGPDVNERLNRLRTAMQLAGSEGAADVDLHVEIHGHYARIQNMEE